MTRGAIGTFIGICIGISVMTGCSVSDGYRSRLAEGCQTEDECTKLLNDAKHRLKYCRDNKFGVADCEEARADLKVARRAAETPSTAARAITSSGK